MYGGWVGLEDYQGVGEPLPPTVVNTTGSFNDGFAAGVFVGRRIKPNLRGEFEFAYRNNTGDYLDFVFTQSGAVTGTAGYDLDGNVNTYNLMTNLFYDFSCGHAGLRPYVGAGLGLGLVDIDLTASNGNDYAADDAVFSYQFIAGLTRDVRPNLQLFAEYRYVDSTSMGIDIPVSGTSYNGSYENASHNVFFGFRKYFR